MARGWESKSVEDQQEAAQSDGDPSPGNKPDPKDSEGLRRLECLQLSRTRILHDLATCTHERYREQLTAALAHVDHELAKGA